MTRYGTFFNAKHIFYERKQIKKLALFLTDVQNSILYHKE
jgi:hypothetical protein